MRLRAVVMASHSYSLTEDELNEWAFLYETMIVQLTVCLFLRSLSYMLHYEANSIGGHKF
jgi:hypothetical protein